MNTQPTKGTTVSVLSLATTCALLFGCSMPTPSSESDGTDETVGTSESAFTVTSKQIPAFVQAGYKTAARAAGLCSTTPSATATEYATYAVSLGTDRDWLRYSACNAFNYTQCGGYIDNVRVKYTWGFTADGTASTDGVASIVIALEASPDIGQPSGHYQAVGAVVDHQAVGANTAEYESDTGSSNTPLGNVTGIGAAFNAATYNNTKVFPSFNARVTEVPIAVPSLSNPTINFRTDSAFACHPSHASQTNYQILSSIVSVRIVFDVHK